MAITAPILFLGGALARAAEAPGGTPTSSSVVWSDANGNPSGPGGTTTTTTTAGSNSPNTDSGVSVSVNGATGSTGGSVDQTFAVSVLPGQLTISPATESVSFAKAHGQGNGGPQSGSLSPITVVDARGSLVGWQATVSLQSVAGVSAADLARATLCVSPDAPTVVAGNPPEVQAGPRVCGSAGDPLELFFAPPNGGGGTFSDTGSLTLHLPGVALPGGATATLAVAVH